MGLPKISLDPAAPDTLYSGAQKINQAIDALDNHIQTLAGHRHTGKDGDAPPIPLEGIDAAAKTTPGGTEPNRIAVTNANGAVGNSERVGGQTLEDLDARYAPASHLASFAHVPYAVATGPANAYSVTLNPAPSSYVEGMAIAVKINADNTGPSTINVNGMGPKPIKKPNGNDVSAGNLKAGSIYTLRYNGTNFILQGEGGGGNAQPGDVLSGKTFTNDYGEQVGTMPNRGAMIITPGTSNITIPAGYHNGSGYVKGDPNLVPENIKQGVSIFGVSGTVVQYKEASGSLRVTSPFDAYRVTGLNFTVKALFIRYQSDARFSAVYTFYSSAVGSESSYTEGWLSPSGPGDSRLSVRNNEFSFRVPDSNWVPGTAYWKAYGI